MSVSVFEHLGVTTCKVIDQRWVFIEKVLKMPILTNISTSVIACKYIARDKYGYHWGLGKPEYVCLDYFLGLCKTNDIGCNGYGITF